jgi:hypothetical protein
LWAVLVVIEGDGNESELSVDDDDEEDEEKEDELLSLWREWGVKRGRVVKHLY